MKLGFLCIFFLLLTNLFPCDTFPYIVSPSSQEPNTLVMHGRGGKSNLCSKESLSCRRHQKGQGKVADDIDETSRTFYAITTDPQTGSIFWQSRVETPYLSQSHNGHGLSRCWCAPSSVCTMYISADNI